MAPLPGKNNARRQEFGRSMRVADYTIASFLRAPRHALRTLRPFATAGRMAQTMIGSYLTCMSWVFALHPPRFPGTRDQSHHVQSSSCVASGRHPRMDGCCLFEFAGCACGWLAPGSVAVAFGDYSSVAQGVHPVAARFPDDPFRSSSCSFCYRRFMVSVTPLWRRVCSSLSGNPSLGSVSCTHPVPARSFMQWRCTHCGFCTVSRA